MCEEAVPTAEFFVLKGGNECQISAFYLYWYMWERKNGRSADGRNSKDALGCRLKALFVLPGRVFEKEKAVRLKPPVWNLNPDADVQGTGPAVLILSGKEENDGWSVQN